MNNGEIKSINMGHIKCDIQDAVTYLKQERNRNGWSIAELSKRSGVSVGVISDLENDKGKVPSLANFIALTRTLRMPEEFVLGLILEHKMHHTYEQHQENIKRMIINNLRDYQIHDEDAIDFIMNTIDFVRNRKKK